MKDKMKEKYKDKIDFEKEIEKDRREVYRYLKEKQLILLEDYKFKPDSLDLEGGIL